MDSENERLKTRPWGNWEVVAADTGYKVKKLIINPKQSISNQYHNHRSEVWCIVKGVCQAFVGERIVIAGKGDIFSVGIGERHRVYNFSDTEELIAIEIQIGDILSEDDIVRV